MTPTLWEETNTLRYYPPLLRIQESNFKTFAPRIFRSLSSANALFASSNLNS
jgi:hypothetical protein